MRAISQRLWTHRLNDCSFFQETYRNSLYNRPSVDTYLGKIGCRLLLAIDGYLST